ncbi:hypothetical protein [Leptolyngbya iicbica]|uniref:Uncharacterized protein n=2 Tax=Cyanophyceae TaxID=3028117 RepID=A0A4Q7E2W5_9CYAN|nr:hypothetical protein [Leptolyngbya sp. LK]RZM76026.1 hypothetical protein DYY88_19215 [Leptolyngbya sp. LK]
MSNSLVWLWRELQEWLAQLRAGLREFFEAVDSSAQPSPVLDFASRDHFPDITTSRVTFIGADIPPFEALEALLDAAWLYLTAQERFIANENQAVIALNARIAAHQRWIQRYESACDVQPVASPDERNLDRNRYYRYQQELAIYQQVNMLRQQQVDSLNRNRIRILIQLDNLRSELLQLHSYCLSVDPQLSSWEQLSRYTRDYRQGRINDVNQHLKAVRAEDKRVIDTFNQRLTQLLKTWHPISSA